MDEAAAYYHPVLDPESLHCFRDFDDASNLESLLCSLQSSTIRNFVLDFSDCTSWLCSDVTTPLAAGLLDTARPECLSTRWINIWHPVQQTSLLQLLAKHYDFSPRLLALIQSDPRVSRGLTSTIPQKKKARKRLRRFSAGQQPLEDGPDESSEESSISSNASVCGGNLYKIINDLWHYSSIDLGRNYVCIGYNSLYGTSNANEAVVNLQSSPLPHCTRVWTWLILCEDNTVISINEDPFPFSNGQLNVHDQHILSETRRNLINILRSLSTASSVQKPMTQLPIRHRVGSTPEESANRQKDMPGLLFYYLFENWHNSYTLITRKESRYGLELQDLRAQMFKTPTLAHIDRLDNIGKELGILKRHFESYNRIIDRVLEPQPASAASVQNMRLQREAEGSVASGESVGRRSSLDTIRPIPIVMEADKESTLGVSLPTPARVRFQRLRDSIDLYALSEVEEYLKQKDSLININFQLIAIKESLDVERLSKTTLLLTKFTILFLPISFMTSYFSVPLRGMEYGVNEYWISFAVTLALSWVALFVFGVVSGSLQTFSAFRATWTALKKMGSWIKARM